MAEKQITDARSNKSPWTAMECPAGHFVMRQNPYRAYGGESTSWMTGPESQAIAVCLNRLQEKLRTSITTLLTEVLDERFEICWCGDPWCQFMGSNGKPILHLTDGYGWDRVAQTALHEATHLQLKQGGHASWFWNRLEQLVLRHLHSELNDHQKKMKDAYLTTPTEGDET